MIEYIEINPSIMAGKPVIKGTRITVENIISLLSQGISFEEIIAEYKGLQKVEILACLKYAEKVLEKTSVFDLITQQ